MKVRGVFFGVVASIFVALSAIPEAVGQESSLELPVELIGFPVIILAVRLSNFAKKLAYSLNPRTYVSRSRRSVESDDMIDMVEAEKRLVAELGENVCIYTRVCLYHAENASRSQTKDKDNIDWNDVFRRLSQLAIQGRQKYPSQFQLHPELFSQYTGPIKPNSARREHYGLLQNYPKLRPYPGFQRPYPGFQRPYPDFQRPYPGLRPKPIPALPPGYHQNLMLNPQSFMGALQSIAQNDDLHCVPRLLCELTSGPSSGQKQDSILPFNINTESLIGLLSAITGPQTSPVLEFGKAALLGYTSKDKSRSCSYAYPRCPRDPDRLVEYLNNYNGGFFRFFNGISPYGHPENPQTPLFPQYPQNYRPPFYPQRPQIPRPDLNPYQQYNQIFTQRPPLNFYQQKKVYAEKRIQNQPVEYLDAPFRHGVRFPNRLQDEVNNEVLPQQEPLVFPEQVNLNGYEQQVREHKSRKQKAVAFPVADYFRKPNLKELAVIFPDRTGTGELKLDVNELGCYDCSSQHFSNPREYYGKLNGFRSYLDDRTNLLRFPLPNDEI